MMAAPDEPIEVTRLSELVCIFRGQIIDKTATEHG
jgi:hypothetical protein